MCGEFMMAGRMAKRAERRSRSEAQECSGSVCAKIEGDWE